MPKLFLTGRDNIKWALDTDIDVIISAVKDNPNIELVEDLGSADIVHSANWHDLLKLDASVLASKKVVTAVPHDIRHMLTQPEYLQIATLVDMWVAVSSRSKQYLDKLGIPNIHIPYGYEEKDHFPMNSDQKLKLRQAYSLPTNRYLIGSFQRDTEGRDLHIPKYIKGPDVFLQAVKWVHARCPQIHVVLAGPRRHWLRSQLDELGIPYTFVGVVAEGDDLTENTLTHARINDLYNAVDVYIVSSRMEGGPKAILECAATKTKIISTDVGIVPDLLDPRQIFNSFVQAGELLEQDILSNTLSQFIDTAFTKLQRHKVEAVVEPYSRLYAGLDAPPGLANIEFKPMKRTRVSLWDRFRGLTARNVSLLYEIKSGPWGGANQFLKALSGQMQAMGVHVSSRMQSAKLLLLNSYHFELDKVLTIKDKFVLHRIDGPTYLIRGQDRGLDENLFAANRKVADITVFQSFWSLFANLDQGRKPVNPVVITNAADPDIFHTKGRVEFDSTRKLRIVSTSWSNNPRKGGPIYKWLDENLDWTKYEYTFVGNVSEEFAHIKVVPPVASGELADILRQHDVYITASDNDPCSNSLIEALTCGLPAVYLARGGHPELVGFGGLGFEHEAQIPSLLEILHDNYSGFQALVLPSDLRFVTQKYLQCFNFGSSQPL